MTLFFYIKDKLVRNPNNWEGLGVQLTRDRDNTSSANPPQQSVSIDRWEWGLGDQTDPNDPATIILNHLPFVTEGIEFRIELEDEGLIEVLFDGYLDPQTAEYDCDLISIEAVEKKNLDWLNGVADSVTYESMFEDGEFSRSDFVSIPYINSTLPNNFEAFISILSMFSIIYILSIQGEEILELVVGSLNPLQFADIIKLVLRGIYVATLFISLIQLFFQTVNLIIQPIKYHEGMYIRDLLRIGANHFGFNFSSSFYSPSSRFYNEVLLPEKYQHNINTNKENIFGFLSPNDPDTFGYFNGTFGDIIRALKIKFNAKLIFRGNNLLLERRDTISGSPDYQTPPLDDDNFRINMASDFTSNILLEYITDFNDKNTLQNYDGTVTKVTQSANTIINPDLLLLKGFERRTIPFARASRKNDLTNPERIIRTAGKVIDVIAPTIVKLYNGWVGIINTVIATLDTILSILAVLGINIGLAGTLVLLNSLLQRLGLPSINIDFGQLDKLDDWVSVEESIEDRRGMLTMENEFVQVPKMFIINEADNPQKTDVSLFDRAFNNTEFLWNNYHFIDSFKPSSEKPNANQYKIYEFDDDVPFCFQDFLDVKNSDVIKDKNGDTAELISLSWNVYGQKAKIEYKVNELYSNNFNEFISTPTGK